jgi:hypothetical protein
VTAMQHESAQVRPSLGDVSKRLRAHLRDAATGPMAAARMIKDEIEPRWDTYRLEAGDVDLSAWLRREVHPGGLPYFEARHRAVQILGAGVCAGLHHEAAVLIAQSVPEGDRLRVCAAARDLFKKQGLPVGLSQASRLIIRVLKRVPKVKPCPTCELLRAQVRELGGEPKV